jgi:hypothetical protein
MDRIYDPVRITHPQLREFAFQVAWIAVVTEAANDLEDLNVDVPRAELSRGLRARTSFA